MKILISLLSLLVTATGLSQQAKVTSKNQNTIIVWSPCGTTMNHKKAMIACAAEGYGIRFSDAETGVITTTMKSSGGSSSVSLNILATDSTVIFRGQMSSSISIDLGSVTAEPSLSELRNRGQKGSPARESWNAMEKVALLISDSLTYETR